MPGPTPTEYKLVIDKIIAVTETTGAGKTQIVTYTQFIIKHHGWDPVDGGSSQTETVVPVTSPMFGQIKTLFDGLGAAFKAAAQAITTPK